MHAVVGHLAVVFFLLGGFPVVGGQQEGEGCGDQQGDEDGCEQGRGHGGVLEVLYGARGEHGGVGGPSEMAISM